MVTRAFSLLVLLASQAVHAGDACQEVARWVAMSKAPAAATPEERELAAKAEWDERVAAAHRVFEIYFGNKSKLEELGQCLVDSNLRDNFYSTVFATFRRRSLEILSSSSSPHIRKLVELLKDRNAQGLLTSTRLTGHVFGPAPTDLRAGFQRASRTAFMDISRIPPNDWLVVFIHEMLHGLDEDLYSAVKIQSEPWRWQLHSSTRPEDQREFKKWIEASLDLGLWGEYRAWYYTLLLYDEGLKEGLWQPVAWIDRTFGKSRDPRSIYQRLEAGFTDPTEGFFSNPTVTDALKKVRSEARVKTPPLGYLQTLFGF